MVSGVAESAYAILEAGKNYPVLLEGIDSREMERIQNAADNELVERLREFLASNDDWQAVIESRAASRVDNGLPESGDGQ
jgi:hypothetical protein